MFPELSRATKLPASIVVLLVLFLIAPSAALAQFAVAVKPANASLPDAPQPAQNPAQPPSGNQQPTAGGNISGTVLDTNGDVVQGARVTLSGPPGANKNTVISGSEGQFQFANLPPGAYTITVSAHGMSKYSSAPIQINPGEFRIVPAITLAVAAAATTVTVTADAEQLSEQQVEIAEQQRVGGVIPNFYSAYDWNAPPMMAKQKYQLIFRALIDPVSFLAVAGIAGAEQYKGIFPAYGSGIEGYGKRYGAALANRVSGDVLSRAVYPSIFHQDPLQREGKR